ncbi:hypothetical protein IQ270_15695 [Microcoleus sp. LEGE 07076]|uniref:hypothetical protein n=1 Tax=Microcoleus sp. LEGE 07076 TaxID=915322 RepID=UPI00187F2649|nr:hypothetical protein [Microcoleus sp. LEGE 07076]MBE9186090.1 hypothetical protein [Microcoleus sp. LEGE 07076]
MQCLFVRQLRTWVLAEKETDFFLTLIEGFNQVFWLKNQGDGHACLQYDCNTITGQQQSKTCAFCVGECKNPVSDADAKKYRLTRKLQQTAKKNIGLSPHQTPNLY